MFPHRSNLFTPIRSVVGDALAFDIKVDHVSPAAQQLGLHPAIKHRATLADSAGDAHLLQLWPAIHDDRDLGGNVVYQAEPQQPQLIAFDEVRPPFSPQASHKSIFALAHSQSDDADLSRQLTVSFQIHLIGGPQLIGGVALAGYPALVYTLDSFGRTSSNYGLPREVRVSVDAGHGPHTRESQFIDADLHYTQQVHNYSSGFHYLHVDPTQADRLMLQISDFPLLLRKIILGSSGVKIARAYGLAIAQLYVFGYRERTRYHHHVPGGVLGALSDTAQQSAEPEPFRAGWHRLIPQENGRGIYQVFPASSIFRPGRQYESTSPAAGYSHAARERFISEPVPPGERLSLICQQSDDLLRSLAGLTLELLAAPADAAADTGNSDAVQNLPPEVQLCDRIGVKVYELDLPSGVSTLNADHADVAKYRQLLAEAVVSHDRPLPTAPSRERGRGVLRFKRSSNLRYFQLEFTNLGEREGRLAIDAAGWIQSAHITVHPKLAHRLQVGRLHFRIVGSDLADDYARIGQQGFYFSIERLSGGRPVQQLAVMRSLTDLMQTGAARLISNSRRRAVEFEKSNIYTYAASPGPRDLPYVSAFPEEEGRHNYEVRYTQNQNRGWTLSESGEGVEYAGKTLGASYASQEVRTHSEHLYPFTNGLEADPDVIAGGAAVATEDLASPYEAAALFLNVGHGLFTDALGTAGGWVLGDSSLLIPPPKVENGQSLNPLNHNFEYWRGLGNPPTVGGLRQISASPFSPIPVSYGGIQQLFTALTAANELLSSLALTFNTLASQNPAPPNLSALWTAVRSALSSYQTLYALTSPLLLVGAAFNAGNGLGIGGSVSPLGIGLSTNSGLLTPSLVFSHTFGSQGIIAKSASKTGYSRSEAIRESKDAASTETLVPAGEHKRIVEQRAVPGTEHLRVRGGEVAWQGELKDIVLGSIPLNLSFPALAARETAAFDDSLQVRFGNGIGDGLEVDFWFELSESEIRDDF